MISPEPAVRDAEASTPATPRDPKITARHLAHGALIYVRQKHIQEGRSFVSQAHEIASTYDDQELGQACLNLEDKIAVIELTSFS